MTQPDDTDDASLSRDDPSRETLQHVSAQAGRAKRRRALVVCGIVTPYTHILYETIVQRHGIDLHVLACSDIEPNRHWRLPHPEGYERATLNGLRWHRGYVSHIYFNPGVIARIVKLRPDVVVVCDFSPTMLIAAATARALGIPVALASDTQLASDPGSHSFPHRMARRLMAPFTNAAIGGSEASLAFFARYGIGKGRGVVSPVVPAWQHAGPVPAMAERPYDILMCGLIDDRWKGALHVLETVRTLRKRGRAPRVRVVGDGPLRQTLEEELARLGVDARFDGYLQQAELAEAYLSARLLLFPSRGDSWGLVANEAAQCGTPVLISPHAEAAFGLVQRFGCGEVLPLDAAGWADAVERYLDDGQAWQRTSEAGLVSARHFSLANSADSFVAGMDMARGSKVHSPETVDAHG